MANYKSGLKLQEGEEIIMELEAELWAQSSNPVARFIGAIYRIIALILGCKKKGFVVVTNKRIVEMTHDVACYCFVTNKNMKYVLPSSIKEVGYKKEATFLCCCPAYTFYYEAFTQATEILLKGEDEAGALRITNTFYNFINEANKK